MIPIGFTLEEYVFGFLGAAVVIGILVFVCMRAIKKGNQEMKEIEQIIPKEDRDKLLVSGFQDYPENKKRLVGTGIVAGIEKEAKKVKITVLYYNSFFRAYGTNKVSVTPDFYEQRQLKVGDFVKTLHVNGKDNTLTIKEIL